MQLLQRLGLAPKKMRPVGKTLETRKGIQAQKERRRFYIFRALLFIVLIGLTLVAFPRKSTYILPAKIGEVWKDADLIAPFDFPVYKSPEELERERREVRLRVPPVFVEMPDAEERMKARADSLRQRLQEVFEKYVAWQMARQRGLADQAAADSQAFVMLKRQVNLGLSEEQWNLLLDAYAQRIPGVVTRSRASTATPPLHEALIRVVLEIGRRINRVGVLSIPKDSVLTSEISVLSPDRRVERLIPVVNIYGIHEARELARQFLEERFRDQPEAVAIGMRFFEQIFIPSLQFDREETYKRWKEAEQRISPTRGMVKEGQVIIRQGEIITREKYLQIQSLAQMLAERQGSTFRWRITTGQFFLTIFTYLIFFLYLYLMRRNIFLNERSLLLIAVVFVLLIIGMAITVRLPGAPGLTVPLALSAVVLTVVFDSRVGVFAVVTLALLEGLIFANHFQLTYLGIFAGILSAFSVRDIRNRGQFVVTAMLVFVAYSLGVGAFSLLKAPGTENYLQDIVWIAINAGSLLFAYPLLWVLERVFDVTTDLRLLELSDTNHPLLRQLSIKAPGTFNHSLMVANLAEAAAEAIGANPFLARVGALYHDVGKLSKPEYFVENQRPGENPHDKLSPHMSALIIASHVKEGLELGKKYGLPSAILDFIATHHGTSRIEYFYRKALEQQKEGETISEADFRYPGPKPFTKETAIVMLADSVEAAARSLDNPTRRKLEALIDDIIKARVEDGQLDDAPLTLRDLTRIKEAFLNVLSGAYHLRVKYPGQKEEEEANEEKRPAQPATSAETPGQTNSARPDGSST